MRACGGRILMLFFVALALTACSRNADPRLLNMAASTEGPDEFAILPNKSLEQPTDFAALPEPTPGGANLADPTPNRDAAEALGGRSVAASRGGVPSADGTLVSYVSRYGVTPGIRQQLAAEDLDFRRRRNGRVMERLFNVNVYFRAYRRQSLDKYAELERFRSLGVRTPAVPPSSTQ